MSQAFAPTTDGQSALYALATRIASIAAVPSDDEETRLQKLIFMPTTVFIVLATSGLGTVMLINNEPVAAAIPLGYGIVTITQGIVLYFRRNFATFRFIQTTLGSVLPFIMMCWLGGYALGGVGIIWSFLAPLLAFLCWGARPAIWWFANFVLLNILAGLLTPFLRTENNLPENVVTLITVTNVAVVTTFAFGTIYYFFQRKERILGLERSNRALEQANVEQEKLLRQSERLATLGRLSAGVAHELNNPAAAVRRGADQLRRNIEELGQAQFSLGGLDANINGRQPGDWIADQLAAPEAPGTLDAIERSDLTAAMETQLQTLGVQESWQHAPALVEMGLAPDMLARDLSGCTPEQLAQIISALSSSHETESLLDELGQGANRIAETVQALKAYTFMDQAPLQFVDIHEELEGTIVILRSKLKTGVEVVRRYADGLPKIDAYGGELNQVWTNLIDNAVEAMDGEGELIIATRAETDHVCVEITDQGRGIPADVQPHIFDPFFTTKPLGQGMGLGLNTTYNIVVQRHGGNIKLRSQPGETTFTVRLPIKHNDAQAPGDPTAA